MNTLDTLLPDVASVYAAASHAPDVPLVRLCYATLQRELLAQYGDVRRALRVRFTDADPYPTAVAMFADMDCGSLRVYTADDAPDNHPMRERVNVFDYRTLDSRRVNVVFRAVHDALAHYPERNDFTARGEFRAFQAHCRTLSPLAQWALATETLGQNAYLHYGPDRATPLALRPFAPQKATLLPRDLVDRALGFSV